MEFEIVKGRPVGTSEIGNNVVHYTCNSPDIGVLAELGISAVGDKYGIDEREVLIIPSNLLERSGLDKDTVGVETFLARLGND